MALLRSSRIIEGEGSYIDAAPKGAERLAQRRREHREKHAVSRGVTGLILYWAIGRLYVGLA